MKVLFTSPITRKLILLGMSFVSLIMVGTMGYELLEGWSFLDSLYMTVITIATVGFREVNTLSTPGIIHTIGLIIFSMVLVALWLAMITSIVIEGQLHDKFRRRKMAKVAAELQDHYIICGAGRTGMPIIEEFMHHRKALVVIESDKDHSESLAEKFPGLPVILGSAIDDEVLEYANIHNAKGLITILSADTDNLFVVISARHINPRLRIMARAFDETTREKLIRAGADHVVCPSNTGGNHIASLVFRPLASNFMDMLASGRQGTPNIHGLLITERSPLCGKTLDEANLSIQYGFVVLAIQVSGNPNPADSLYAPEPSTVIEANSTLYIFCEPSSTAEYDKLVANA